MSVLIVSLGAMSGHDQESVGRYLSTFDPDGEGGRGVVRWSADPAKAIRFPDRLAAFRCWKTRSASVPSRPDGKPNRPLTAYSITLEDAP